MNTKKVALFIALIALCESVGVIGSAFTMDAIPNWYATIAKPSFTPPSWVFGPAWTILYALMGIALFLVLQRRHERSVKPAVIVFFIQLFLNALWSPAFFGLRSPVAGLVVIVPLLVSIAFTTVMFFRISRPAGIIFLPYLLWVSFAGALNYYIVRLN